MATLVPERGLSAGQFRVAGSPVGRGPVVIQLDHDSKAIGPEVDGEAYFGKIVEENDCLFCDGPQYAETDPIKDIE